MLLVEPSVYRVDLLAPPLPPDTNEGPQGNKKRGGRGRKSKKTKKQKGSGGKQHGDARGAKRGSRGGKDDSVFILEQPKLDVEAADEGLHVLAQTGKCRRLVLTEIYNNKPPRKS